MGRDLFVWFYDENLNQIKPRGMEYDDCPLRSFNMYLIKKEMIHDHVSKEDDDIYLYDLDTIRETIERVGEKYSKFELLSIHRQNYHENEDELAELFYLADVLNAVIKHNERDWLYYKDEELTEIKYVSFEYL